MQISLRYSNDIDDPLSLPERKSINSYMEFDANLTVKILRQIIFWTQED